MSEVQAPLEPMAVNHTDKRLLALPAELRRKVYRELRNSLTPDAGLSVRCEDGELRVGAEYSRDLVNLMQTCRLLYLEVLPFFYDTLPMLLTPLDPFSEDRLELSKIPSVCRFDLITELNCMLSINLLLVEMFDEIVGLLPSAKSLRTLNFWFFDSLFAWNAEQHEVKSEVKQIADRWANVVTFEGSLVVGTPHGSACQGGCDKIAALFEDAEKRRVLSRSS